MPGVKTTDLTIEPTLDSVVGNRNGTPVKVPMVDFARQLFGLGVLGADEWLTARAWAVNPEDEFVVLGSFYALHYSLKALAASSFAVASKDIVLATASPSGPVQFFDIKADAVAASLSANDVANDKALWCGPRRNLQCQRVER